MERSDIEEEFTKWGKMGKVMKFCIKLKEIYLW